jgi:hypothetical protein
LAFFAEPFFADADDWRFKFGGMIERDEERSGKEKNPKTIPGPVVQILEDPTCVQDAL